MEITAKFDIDQPVLSLVNGKIETFTVTGVQTRTGVFRDKGSVENSFYYAIKNYKDSIEAFISEEFLFATKQELLDSL